MEPILLSRHDINVLEKIKDPESDPSTSVLVDPSLPKDPNIPDPAVYDLISRRERDIVLSMQQLEMQLLRPESVTVDPAQNFKTCVLRLGELITEFPRYASARNNRAQALRRLHGDAMLLEGGDPGAILRHSSNVERENAVITTLSDLDEAIMLLKPRGVPGSISPQAVRTLSFAHTQRAALYHKTAKFLSNGGKLELSGQRKESKWCRSDFEEAASRDFASGGRYGNEIAKGLAVSTNPTAKLCGQMVREALRKEYGPAYGS